MANLKGPLFGFDAEGSIGKQVTYSKWKSVTYAKVWREPKDRKSSAQVLARDTWRVGNGIWKTTPTLFREPWDLSARPVVKSGYNVWMGSYLTLNLGQPSFVQLRMSPAANGGVGPRNFALVPGSAQITVNFDIAAGPTGWFLQAAVAGAIESQNPATAAFHRITINQGAVPPGVVVLAGLKPLTAYVATAWLRWVLPSGITAWSQSLAVQGVTTLA